MPFRSTRTVSVVFTVPRARVRTVDSGMFSRAPRAVNAYLGSASNPDVFYVRSPVARTALSCHSVSIFLPTVGCKWPKPLPSARSRGRITPTNRADGVATTRHCGWRILVRIRIFTSHMLNEVRVGGKFLDPLSPSRPLSPSTTAVWRPRRCSDWPPVPCPSRHPTPGRSEFVGGVIYPRPSPLPFSPPAAPVTFGGARAETPNTP